MSFAVCDKETCNVLPKGKADSESQTRRLSVQGVRVRHEEKEKNLFSEEGQGMISRKGAKAQSLICGFSTANLV
jgi:hypothetical protein